MKAHLLSIAIATVTASMLSACSLNDDDSVDVSSVVTGDTIILTDNGVIASVNKAAPDVLVSTRTVTGLNAGDQLIGIDYRPKDGKLYGVGVASNGAARIYTINPSTGQAVLGNQLTIGTTGSPLLIGGDRGMMALDFNPVPDRLRLITNTDKNYRINVDTGTTTLDSDINGASATITSAAYTNSVNGTGNTQLIDLDVEGDRIYVQGNPDPNAGTLAAFAPLGVNAIDSSGFDIDPTNNKGYAALKVGTNFGLYTIDLNTIGTTNNAATVSGTLNTYFSTNGIRGLALKPAADAGLTAVGLSANNQLIKFTPNDAAALGATPPLSAATTLINVTGLGANETLVGIDYRLRTDATGKTGLLYGLSNLSKIYTINTTTGAATAALNDSNQPVSLFTSANSVNTPLALTGSSFAVDFNPAADRLRVISDTGTSLRINVDSGLTVVDGNIKSMTVNNPVVTAAAYTNSIASSPPFSTKLFDLDQTNNLLLLQDPPNDGVVSQAGTLGLGITLGNSVGFDIAGGFNGITLGVNGKSLFTVNLATGAATTRGTIGDASTPNMIDIALLIK